MADQSGTIFLAEDDDDDCLIFQEALQELNCTLEIVVSKNGVELMENLNKMMPRLPYVLFLDMNMPRKNGFECLSEIREKDEFKDIPVVILSTSNQQEHIAMAYCLGAKYYMHKPTHFSQLVEGIEKILFSNSLSNGPTPFNEFIIQS